MANSHVKMKANSQVKIRGSSRISAQQLSFELKQKVVAALNKLSDRDTCQIAVDELEKTAECLTQEGIAPFLSCILDIDSDLKSSVRKECIRLMGSLATFHEGLVYPHLGKMVTSIVKRLKDSDSVVRDACVQTTGVLALKLGNNCNESHSVFVSLVKPLFGALGEQSKQVQLGSALCLAKVIDNIHDPPVSILQRMLARTVKLLKNQHFMAKPAVIELNRSIIQAGGASTKSLLSTAMSSIQEALKTSDWSTRKAAAAALNEIACSGGSLFGPFKASCLRSLESCRFDKVKPVRDTALDALQNWRSIQGSDTPVTSEVGSSMRENSFGGDYCDITSTCQSREKDSTLTKGTSETARRSPLSVRKLCHDYNEGSHPSRADDWKIEISVPKAPKFQLHKDYSEGSSITKTMDSMSADVTSIQEMGYEYVQMDEKQQCSSVHNISSGNFDSKFSTVSHELEHNSSPQRFVAKDMSGQEQIYSPKVQDRRSLDSTVVDSQECCFEVSKEIVCIREQLLEIKSQQSSMMNLLQVFSTGVMDNLSMLQSKVLGLENAVDKIGQHLVHGVRCSDPMSSKLMKQSQSACSPRLSTCTPRSSVDIRSRKSSLLSTKNGNICEENNKSRPINFTMKSTDLWTNTATRGHEHSVKNIDSSLTHSNPMDLKKNVGSDVQNMFQMRKNDRNSRQNSSEVKFCLWQRVKDCLCKGDVESAYVEAINSGDEPVLVELFDKTGPVLESLSDKTISHILSLFASFFLEQRFTSCIIPWLEQVIYFSTLRGPRHLAVSAKVKVELLSAIQEAMNMEHSNSMDRKSLAQVAMKLHRLWGGGCT